MPFKPPVDISLEKIYPAELYHKYKHVSTPFLLFPLEVLGIFNPLNSQFLLTKRRKCGNILGSQVVRHEFNTETYRSGHNGAHSKCVCPNGHVSSNLTVSAKNESSPLDCFFVFGTMCSARGTWCALRAWWRLRLVVCASRVSREHITSLCAIGAIHHYERSE